VRTQSPPRLKREIYLSYSARLGLQRVLQLLTAAARGLDGAGFVQVHIGRRQLLVLRGIDETLLDIPGKAKEGIFHIIVALCACLHELDA